MSAYNGPPFGPPPDSPHLRLALAQCSDAAARLRVVENLRRSVTEQLQGLAGRVHPFDPEDNDQVVVFVLAARRHATPAEKKLLDLLRACVDAQETGDVPVFADLRHREDQQEQARANGKKGGRPRKADEHAAIRARFDERRRRFPMLTKHELYEDVGYEFGKTWETVRDIVTGGT